MLDLAKNDHLKLFYRLALQVVFLDDATHLVSEPILGLPDVILLHYVQIV